MHAHVFAEDSNTTTDDPDLPLAEYYQGLFSIVAGLSDDLSELADTHLHVLSEDFGVGEGTQSYAELTGERGSSSGREEMTDAGRETLLETAPDADVMVVLLSTDVFDATVGDHWDELVEAAKPGSVWCLSAARSSLDALPVDDLEAKGCTVITYQRVGVARIGSETRGRLLETVRLESDQ
jgi:hypothetical protein